MDYDIFSNGKSVNAIDAQTINTETTTYGNWIDTQFYGSIVAGIDVAWTSGNITEVSWQESDEVGHGDAADIDDAVDLYYPDKFPVAESTVIRTGTVSKSRWVRLKIVTTGTVNLDVFGMAELRHPRGTPPEVESSILTTDDINAPGETADAIVTPPKRTS